MFIRGLCYATGAGLFGLFYESEILPNLLIESPLTNKIRVGSRVEILGETVVDNRIKVPSDVARKLSKREWQLIELVKQAKEELTTIDYISVYFDDSNEEHGKHGRARALSSRMNNSAIVHFSNVDKLKEDELEGVVYQAIASIKHPNFAKTTTLEQIVDKTTTLLRVDYSVCLLLCALKMRRSIPHLKISTNEPFNVIVSFLMMMELSSQVGRFTVTPLQRYMVFQSDNFAAESGKGVSLAKYLMRCQNENPDHDVYDPFAVINTSDINYSERLDNLNNALRKM